LPLDLSYRPIDEATITAGFSCGEKELDRFFSDKALKDHNNGTIRTTCSYLSGVDRPVGFYSLATVAERSRLLKAKYHALFDSQHFPCLQLVYLAVHRSHQRAGIGTAMVGAVIEAFASIGTTIGLPCLILVPINDAVIPFYEDQLGFTCYMNRQRMYLTLADAIDAMATPPASDDAPTLDIGI
jgi:GNAT superfamily N-acetyltransferase